MFSWKADDKKKKAAPRNPSRGPRDDARLAQLGLLGVGGMDDLNLAEEPTDPGLEAELLALVGEDSSPEEGSGRGRRGAAPRAGGGGGDATPVLPAGLQQLDKMVTECLSDDYNVEVTSDDEDDPALLDELLGLSDADPSRAPEPPPPNAPVIQRPSPAAAGSSVLALLNTRIENYQRAEAQATIDNDSMRARRYARGLKTLTQMKKNLEAGKAIKEEDIPPEVYVRSRAPTPAPEPEPEPATALPPRTPASPRENLPAPVFPNGHSSGSSDNRASADLYTQEWREKDSDRKQSSSSLPHAVAFADKAKSGDAIKKLTELQSTYKMAALKAKQSGDQAEAMRLFKISKQLQPLLEAAQRDEPVDMSSLPPPPGQDTVPNAAPASPAPAPVPAPSEMGPVEDTPDPPPVPPGSILDALVERKSKYVEQLEKAKAESNARKERMNQRIIKQYDDAIKRHKLGKPVAYDDLPTPPGFAPLPSSAVTPAHGAPAPAPAADPAPSPAPAAAPSAGGGDGPTPPKQPRPQPGPAPPKANVRAAPKSRVERQMSLLTKRQQQFKAAALDAKKRGEIEQAKEYLRNCKGFDNLIQATAAGLPVDMNTIPVPPQEKAAGGPCLTREMSVDNAFEVINAEDCYVPADNTPADLAVLYAKLEEDLIKQIKMCATTREHFKAVGDVASSNRFEQLIVNSKKDLDAIRLAFKRGDKPPRCHYENRSFSIVECNTDLNDSDCEVVVMRGVNYNVQNPTDVDTYVKIEFPYPAENNPQDRTGVVKDTNNPEYNHKTIFSIDRKSRALARCFKRHGVKLTIHAKGGWFHRDTIVGLAKVPLVALENNCTLHDSFDLCDERKKMVGGKIEVKVRVRNPILNKEIRQVNEKWLVIDGF